MPVAATIAEVVKEVIRAITAEVIAIKVELITAIGKVTTIEKAPIIAIEVEAIAAAAELDYIASSRGDIAAVALYLIYN